MANKIKLTRPELKRYREALRRYERYLPMLKLKQQRLQVMLREVAQQRAEAERLRDEIEDALRQYETVLADRAGVPLEAWAKPSEVFVDEKNVAGVPVPVFRDVAFPEARYSLFGTPPWVDQALADLRERSRRQAMLEVLEQQERLLLGELTRIIQRVNLFEKIMIPDAREAIRRIRIKLGDEMTDAVGRSKIAKKKLAEALDTEPGTASTVATAEEDQPNAERVYRGGAAMIVPMWKIYLVARQTDRDRLLDILRELGIVHLVPVDPELAVPDEATSRQVDAIQSALQVLSGVEPRGSKPEISPAEAAREVLDIQRRVGRRAQPPGRAVPPVGTDRRLGRPEAGTASSSFGRRGSTCVSTPCRPTFSGRSRPSASQRSPILPDGKSDGGRGRPDRTRSACPTKPSRCRSPRATLRRFGPKRKTIDEALHRDIERLHQLAHLTPDMRSRAGAAGAAGRRDGRCARGGGRR